MGAEFSTGSIFSLGNLLAVQGEVKEGIIRDDDMGTTTENKRFKIVRIQTKDGPIPRAEKPMRVTLILRDIGKPDISAGETLYIE